jgi:hypothetical protein
MALVLLYVHICCTPEHPQVGHIRLLAVMPGRYGRLLSGFAAVGDLFRRCV